MIKKTISRLAVLSFSTAVLFVSGCGKPEATMKDSGTMKDEATMKDGEKLK